MIIALSRFRVANGCEAQVTAAFLDRPHLVDTAAGFLGMETFVGAEAPDTFYLVTRWTDRVSFQAWHRSAAHRDSHRFIPKGLKLDPAFTQVVVLQRLAQAQTFEELTTDAAPVLARYLEHTPSLYIISADRDGRIRGCNQAVATRLHRVPADLVGRELWPLLTAPDAATLRERIRAGRRAPDERLLLNLLDADQYPYSLDCAIDIQPDGFLLVGEARAQQERAALEQLFQLNNELATLTRENARKNRALELANARIRTETEERARAQEALLAQALQLAERATLLDLAHDAIIVHELASARIRYWNRGAEALFGWSATAAQGRVADALLTTQFFAQPRDAIIAELLSTGQWDGELVRIARTGRRLVVASRWALQRDAAGLPQAILEINTDITARKEAEERLRFQALHDPLTGLANRANLLDYLGEALATARRDGTALAIFLLDLNGFKTINDTHGHQAGDVVLIETGRRVQHCLHTSDMVARMGGDEFAVLLPATDRAGAILTAGKIIAAINEAIAIDDLRVHVGTSIGIVLVPEHGFDPLKLLHGADLAMYHAKRGGHGYTLYGSEQGGAGNAVLRGR